MLTSASLTKHLHPLSKCSALMPNCNNHSLRTPYVSKLGLHLEETFIVMNQTSFPTIGHAVLRKHVAILDTHCTRNNRLPEDPNHDGARRRNAKMQPQAHHDQNRIKAYDTCTRYPYHLGINTSEYRTSNNWNNSTPTTI